jgi:peptidoglycan/LPS O-acetylase OafA/YrhL
VISGFCLTLPVVGAGGALVGGAKDFFRRRARRILPPYYGALALSMVLILTVIGQPTGTLWDVPIRVTSKPSALLAHLLLVQNFFGTGLINYVLWSIAVEWQIYFLFPLLVLAWRRFGPWLTVAAALVVGFALRFGFEGTRIARSSPHYIGMFVLGMLAAYVATSPREDFARLRQHRVWGWLGLACFAAVAAAPFLWGIKTTTERFTYVDLPVGLLATCLLVVTSRSRGSQVARLFTWKPLVFIGTFSYSLYLLHAPLLQLMWQYGLHPAGLRAPVMFALLMVAGLPLVLLVSYGFFRVLEEPFMRKRRKVDGGVPVARPAA